MWLPPKRYPLSSRGTRRRARVSDAHGEMLALAVKLATKAGAGKTLTASQQMVADILWVDTQVSPNGFDGWLYYTSSERIAATLHALEHLGCLPVLELVREALAIIGVDPFRMPDEQREAQLDSLVDEARDRLSEVDDRFHEAVEDCMATCQAFVESHKQEFAV